MYHLCQKEGTMKTIIHENQRGLLFFKGQFEKLLIPGQYHTFFHRKIEILSLEQALQSDYASLDTLLENQNIQNITTVVEVKDEELALHFVNGQFKEILPTGHYAYFTIHQQHSFQIIDINNPYVQDNIPRYIFQHIPEDYYIKIEVMDYEKALLFYNNQFIQLLDSGTYYFWKQQTKIDYQIVDTRLCTMNIIGQEILTQDKVSLRLTFVCHYKLTNYIKVFQEINDFQEQLRVTTQLIMREYIGQYKIDELLENKDMISKCIFETLKEKAKNYYVDIVEAGIKDIILPGEMKTIMNTVLIAQKQAQANVITRREEVASTRSLLNTAILMDENKTLYKLKELEYLERICQNVGEINVNGHQELLEQLTKIMRGHDI